MGKLSFIRRPKVILAGVLFIAVAAGAIWAIERSPSKLNKRLVVTGMLDEIAKEDWLLDRLRQDGATLEKQYECRRPNGYTGFLPDSITSEPNLFALSELNDDQRSGPEVVDAYLAIFLSHGWQRLGGKPDGNFVALTKDLGQAKAVAGISGSDAHGTNLQLNIRIDKSAVCE